MMFPKDISALLALELNYPNIVNLCLSNKKFNREICGNESFWLNKLKVDFPQEEFKEYREKSNQTFREKYRKLYNDFPNFFLHVEGPNIGETYLNLEKITTPISKYVHDRSLLGFDSPAFIKPEYVNFFKEADFGRLEEQYGGSSINEILDPILKYGILSRIILTPLLIIYLYKNKDTIIFMENEEIYFRVDELMNRYFDDILTKLENEEQLTDVKGRMKLKFDRNKFSFRRLISIMNEVLIRNDQRDEKQKALIENKDFAPLLHLIYRILSFVRTNVTSEEEEE